MYTGIVRFQTAGFHYWPEAPERLSFLRSPHRHDFHFTVHFKLDYSRSIELIECSYKCQEVVRFLGIGTPYGVNFGVWSCEDLAKRLGRELLLKQIPVTQVEVSEDGVVGAIWTEREVD